MKNKIANENSLLYDFHDVVLFDTVSEIKNTVKFKRLKMRVFFVILFLLISGMYVYSFVLGKFEMNFTLFLLLILITILYFGCIYAYKPFSSISVLKELIVKVEKVYERNDGITIIAAKDVETSKKYLLQGFFINALEDETKIIYVEDRENIFYSLK